MGGARSRPVPASDCARVRPATGISVAERERRLRHCIPASIVYRTRVKPVVVLGFLGTQLDSAKRDRWARWRPTVDLCRQEELVIDRLELMHNADSTSIFEFVSQDIEGVSPETEVGSHIIELDDPWDFEEVYGKLYDFARRYPFQPDKEDYLVHITTGTHVAQICLFLLTESRHLPGKLLQSSPPSRKGSGEVGEFHIIDLDLSRFEQLLTRFESAKREASNVLKAGIETRNVAFNALIEHIEKVAAASKSPLLLTGPTGAGKTALARRIFELKKSRRQVEGRFVELNCATLRGDGAMSALFGHAKGAFTGAVTERKGMLKSADGGLLFLDEIGELGADEQAMLLRAIEDKVFVPMGTDREIRSDFQLIAGTHRDLRTEVAKGRFREDLLNRINLWTFALPALRERSEDIDPNIDFELERWGQRNARNVRFSRSARQRFARFARSPEALWSGNFREFGGAIERMATLCEGGHIVDVDVDAEIDRLRRAWQGQPLQSSGDDSVLARHLSADAIAGLDRFDSVQLAEVLRHCETADNLSAAGRSLFAQSRLQKKSSNDADRIRKYLARFDLSWRVIHGRASE